MAIQSFLLDPNAQAYTDNEIITKVNNATNQITRVGFTDLDKISEGTTKKSMTDTEKTKLTNIENGATADLSATEIRDLILGLADTNRRIVITDPQSNEFTVVAIQRNPDGKLRIEFDDVAQP